MTDWKDWLNDANKVPESHLRELRREAVLTINSEVSDHWRFWVETGRELDHGPQNLIVSDIYVALVGAYAKGATEMSRQVRNLLIDGDLSE